MFSWLLIRWSFSHPLVPKASSWAMIFTFHSPVSSTEEGKKSTSIINLSTEKLQYNHTNYMYQSSPNYMSISHYLEVSIMHQLHVSIILQLHVNQPLPRGVNHVSIILQLPMQGAQWAAKRMWDFFPQNVGF